MNNYLSLCFHHSSLLTSWSLAMLGITLHVNLGCLYMNQVFGSVKQSIDLSTCIRWSQIFKEHYCYIWLKYLSTSLLHYYHTIASVVTTSCTLGLCTLYCCTKQSVFVVVADVSTSFPSPCCAPCLRCLSSMAGPTATSTRSQDSQRHVGPALLCSGWGHSS